MAFSSNKRSGVNEKCPCCYEKPFPFNKPICEACWRRIPIDMKAEWWDISSLRSGKVKKKSVISFVDRVKALSIQWIGQNSQCES